MPDIAMCLNDACPLRMGCYRFRAIPHDTRQAYAGFEYQLTESGPSCEHFMTIHNGRRIDDDQKRIQCSYNRRWEHLQDA